MKTALLALSVLAALLLAPLGMRMADEMVADNITTQTLNSATKDRAIPRFENSSESAEVKVEGIKKIITIEKRNTVTIRGPITDSSVAKAMKELRAVSRSISKNTDIFLVLDTPGGSIVAGTDLIDFAAALPQKVHTITLFAASMGFQIVQNLNTRYILRSGTLMSHRARVEGMGGQIKGEFETRYKMVRRSVDYLDYVAATRMGLSVKDYEAKIMQEYWVFGFDAISDKAADEQILLKCGDSLNGSDTIDFETMFGNVKVTFSDCPLIKSPEKIEMEKVQINMRADVERAIKMSIDDKPRFINEFIDTSRFSELFR